MIKSGKTITVSNSLFFKMSAIYLIAPILVFFFAWLKIYIAIPAALLIGFSCFYAFKDSKKDNLELVSSDKSFVMTRGYLISLIVISVILTILFGIGEYIWAADDHAYRRAILRDLISYKWPVIYDLSNSTNPDVNAYLADTKVGFSYYFSFWLIPALIGKVFGFGAANVSLVIWSSFGIFLILLGMAMLCKRQNYSTVFALVFFSGLDIIPFIYFEFFGEKQYWMWLEGYTQHIVYISNINNLLNVYNQCIPCYIMVLLLLLMNNRRSIGLVVASCFAYSPWATFGIIPIAVYKLFEKSNRNGDNKIIWKNIFSIGNIVPSLTMLLVFAPMYMANTSATSVKGTTLSFYGSFGKLMLAYLFVIVIEILPSFILFGKQRIKDGLFWTVIGVLLVMPFYKISYQNDFNMRGAMPEFFVLTIMFAIYLSNAMAYHTKDKFQSLHLTPKFILKAVTIAVMSCVALQMFLVIFSSTFEGKKGADDIYSFGDVRNYNRIEIVEGNFYVYDYEDTFFYKHMAR